MNANEDYPYASDIEPMINFDEVPLLNEVSIKKKKRNPLLSCKSPSNDLNSSSDRLDKLENYRFSSF